MSSRRHRADLDIDVLLDAVVSVGRGLELETTLQQVVRAAATVVDARYAALGVLGDDERITRFITVGMSAAEVEAVGPRPTGRGILGEVMRHRRPMRLPDVTAHPKAAGFPEHHPAMRSFLGMPLQVHGEPFGNLYLTEKRDGGEFTEDDQRLLEAFASAASVAVENARLYEEARLRERWSRADDEIARRLLAGEDPDAVLDLVTAGATTVAAADTAVIAVPSDDGPAGDVPTLTVRAAVGIRAEALRGRSLRTAGSFVAKAYAEERPIVTSDASRDDRAQLVLHPAGTIGPLAVFPLVGRGRRVLGVLAVGRVAGAERFRDVVVEALGAFANQAAVALELAERRADAARLAVVRDRDRIARDLHDLAVQRLYATGLSLQAVDRRLADARPLELDARQELGSRVGEAIDQIDETIDLIRTTIRDLRDPGSDAPRRVATRALLLAEVEAATHALGFAPTVRLEGPIDAQVPSTTTAHLVAVLRETLSNTARHARATRAHVRLRVADDLLLTVTDDGSGITPDAPRSGLANLARRATELGGSFEVRPGPAGGTAVHWRVPLPTTS
ncbi:GAF domain-containing protein [Isoptericola sp. 4D.3]|uniref:GAF domain-containing protein n=1 Tax=Isoptericola peretonis TaxID=2918523 RepID=A0ABT0J7I3_9MICO|nr:GAF domain-containing protein [Isoptericola sp. 4D.3]